MIFPYGFSYLSSSTWAFVLFYAFCTVFIKTLKIFFYSSFISYVFLKNLKLKIMLRLSIYGSFTLILSYASPLSKASGLLVFLSYRIFSIKPPGGGIFISSTLEGGGGA